MTQPVGDDQSVPSGREGAPPPRRRPAIVGVGVTVVAVVAAVAALVLLLDDEPEAAPPEDLDASAPVEDAERRDDADAGPAEAADPGEEDPERDPDEAAPPRPELPEAPWAGDAVEPGPAWVRETAEWWDQYHGEWLPEAGIEPDARRCDLFLPTGFEEMSSTLAPLEFQGPLGGPPEGLHLGWWWADGTFADLELVIWDLDAPQVAPYLETEPATEYADGSLLYDHPDASSIDRLLAIAGQECFYEIRPEAMVQAGWGLELRLIATEY
ncbi:hypothetical protein FTX61_04190 [Nitriliruptoraceae bacterium ZYF776]|nr:hypothetical protein [Profundirhabdus halotolerans]